MKGAYVLLVIAFLGLALLIYYLVSGVYTTANLVTASAIFISNVMFFYILKNQDKKK
ncbi:MAG: hypothetical protein ABNH00_02585 [Dokdonia sp.]|jgi:hypothetical protein